MNVPTSLMDTVPGLLFCGRSLPTRREQPCRTPVSPAFSTAIRPERLQTGLLSPGASPEGFRARYPPLRVARREWLAQSLASGHPGAVSDRAGLQSRVWEPESSAVGR